MQRLTRTPLPIFLPDVAAAEVAVLGSEAPTFPGFEGAPDAYISETRDTPAAVVWYLERGEEAEDSRSIELLTRCLGAGGGAVLVWRSHTFGIGDPPSIVQRLSDDREVTLSTFGLHERTFVPTGGPETSFLSETSKAALVRRTIRRLLPFSGIWRRWAPRWHVTLILPNRATGSPWIQELISLVAGSIDEELSVDDIRWVSRTKMSLAVAKIVTGSGQRFALSTALDEEADRRLSRQIRTLQRIRATDRLPRHLEGAFPSTVDMGTTRGRSYLLTEWIDGTPGSRLMYSPTRREKAVDSALRWITSLHQASEGPEVDAAEVGLWAERVLRGVGSRAGSRDERFEDEIRQYLGTALRRDPLPTVLGHGDYWLGNVTFDPSTWDVVAVFDWDQADFSAPPLEDVLHLLFYRKGILSTYRPCRHLVKLLTDRLSSRTQDRIGSYWLTMGLDPVQLGPTAILYWLRFLDRREEQFPRSAAWYRENYLSIRNLLQDKRPDVLDGVGVQLL